MKNVNDMKNKKLAWQFQKGFTLIEVLIVVVMVGILSAVAIPSIKEFSGRQQIKTQADAIAGILSFARTHALSVGSVRPPTPAVVVQSNVAGAAFFPVRNDGGNGPELIQPGFTAAFDAVTGQILKIIPNQPLNSTVFITDNDGDDRVGFTRQGRLVGGPAAGIFAILFCRSNTSSYNLTKRNGEARRVEVAASGRVSQKLNTNLTGVANLQCQA